MTQKPLDTNNPNSNARPASQNSTAAPRPRAVSDNGKLNGGQRNVIRMMLATASTVAVVISAQAMATLDRSATTVTAQSTVAASSAVVASVPTVVASATPVATTTSATAVQSSVAQPRPVTRSSRG